MNKLLQTFLDGLRDRIVASLASVVGSTFSAFRVAQEAEQQSFLEDLARRYEAEGKPTLAEQLRCRAKTLSMDNPAAESQPVFENILADKRRFPALPDAVESTPDHTENGEAKQRKVKSKRTRKSSQPVDDASISLD